MLELVGYNSEEIEKMIKENTPDLKEENEDLKEDNRDIVENRDLTGDKNENDSIS